MHTASQLQQDGGWWPSRSRAIARAESDGEAEGEAESRTLAKRRAQKSMKKHEKTALQPAEAESSWKQLKIEADELPLVSHLTHKTMLSPRTLSLFYIENTSVHRKVCRRMYNSTSTIMVRLLPAKPCRTRVGDKEWRNGAVRLPKILVLKIDDFVSPQLGAGGERDRELEHSCQQPAPVADHVANKVIFLSSLDNWHQRSIESSDDGSPRAKSASRSLRRALLMPQVNTGSRYRRGKSSLWATAGGKGG